MTYFGVALVCFLFYSLFLDFCCRLQTCYVLRVTVCGDHVKVLRACDVLCIIIICVVLHGSGVLALFGYGDLHIWLLIMVSIIQIISACSLLFYICEADTGWSLELWTYALYWFSDASSTGQSWQVKFRKIVENNPILTPLSETEWKCPVRNALIRWEEKDVFNPAAVVRDNKVYLLYRAEDTVWRYTSYLLNVINFSWALTLELRASESHLARMVSTLLVPRILYYTLTLRRHSNGMAAVKIPA